MRPSLILHGGAHAIADYEMPAHEQGCLRALEAGWKLLQAGESAVAAVEAAVRVLEDDPTFNAGTGSVRNREGDTEMDAAIMDGATMDIGAVGVLRRVRNPISAARRLLYEKTVLLAGEGATRFAHDHGLASPESPPAALPLPSAHAGDTVGCVALDTAGHFAVGTSTGGLEGKLPGRIGDSPLPGCGYWAEDGIGGCALTGDGESIIRTALAQIAMATLRQGSAEAAASAAIRHLRQRVKGEAGCIALDREGRAGWAHNSSHLAVAYMNAHMERPFFGSRRHLTR